MDNEFIVEVCEDGKIKVTSLGGFSQEIHRDADQFLQTVKDLAGGVTETRKLQPSLANPHTHSHKHGNKHSH